MTDETLKSNAAKILAQQPATRKQWGQREHSAMLVLVIKDVFGDDLVQAEEKAALFEAFAKHGLGGNASAFRQWLEAQKLLPPSGAKVIASYDV